MDKILLIIQREYLTRVRKKSFLVMSIIGPVLFAAIYIIPIWLASSSSDELTVKVQDESGLFSDQFNNAGGLSFIYTDNVDLDADKASLKNSKEFDALLHIPNIDLDDPSGVTIYAKQTVSPMTAKSIERIIENKIEDMKMENAGLDRGTIESMDADVNISTIDISKGEEKESSTMAATAVGFISGFLIYFFTFLYGAQVMQGVIEEKSSRIVEVIISSVKPFQLMMGKIIGVASVGLTQLFIWIVLGLVVTLVASQFVPVDMANAAGDMQQVSEADQEAVNGMLPEIMRAANTINFPLIIGAFVFYFLFGYLLYAAMFGAIGAAVDNQTETQQFMLPVTIPLILAIIMSTSVVSNPNGPVAFWMSMIPLTSPIIMMIRLPFIGFTWELLLSMVLLVAGFVFFTWLAGRIYRVGILMYGKKVTYKELGKWLFYKG